MIGMLTMGNPLQNRLHQPLLTPTHPTHFEIKLYPLLPPYASVSTTKLATSLTEVVRHMRTSRNVISNSNRRRRTSFKLHARNLFRCENKETAT